jgi:hypothetical protein
VAAGANPLPAHATELTNPLILHRLLLLHQSQRQPQQWQREVFHRLQK